MQNNKEKKNVFEIENPSFAYDKHEVLNNLNLSFHDTDHYPHGYAHLHR